MRRFLGTLLAGALAIHAGLAAGAVTAAQQPPAPVTPSLHLVPALPVDEPAAGKKVPPSAPPTTDDICRTLEQAASRNGLPVEFFARVIWQESRFNARAVSRKGAEGIAQFMPQTAGFRGLADPFDPIAAVSEAASYLAELRKQFGNIGLAAAGYNAGPGRVSAWLGGRRTLPAETRDYVAIVTGWTADEWASASPPGNAETAIPQGVPCTTLANLVLAPADQARRIAAHVPRWGMQIVSGLSERQSWAAYRRVEQAHAALLGGREPMVLRGRLPGMGAAPRYMIRIVGDDRKALQSLCGRLLSVGGSCVVLRNYLPHATKVD
jgi:hypothetical protein